MEQNKGIPDWVNYDDKQKIDLLHRCNIVDFNERDVFFAITDYAQKNNTSYIPIPSIYEHIKEYSMYIHNATLKYVTTVASIVKKLYQYLYQNNYCVIDEKGGKVTGIELIDPNRLNEEQIRQLIENIRKDYSEMENNDDKPFPSFDEFKLSGISENILSQISIKNLTKEKAEELSAKASIVKIVLSSNESVIIPAEKIKELYDKSFSKIRRFFIKSKEFASLILLKMRQQYPHLINYNTTDDLVSNAERPPQYYVYLSNEILMNMHLGETNKAVIQATEIFKALTIVRIEQEQKKILAEKIMEILFKAMESHPVLFDKNNILLLRENNQLLKVCPENDFLEIVDMFLQRYSVNQADGNQTIIPISVKDESFYIHHKHFYNFFVTRIDSAAYKMQQEIINLIDQDPQKFLNSAFMKSKEAFFNFVEENFRIKDDFIIEILKNPSLLYIQLFLRFSNDISIAPQLKRFFVLEDVKPSSLPPLRPVHEILNLDYNIFLKDAKAKAPININASFMKMIIDLFKNLFTRFLNKKNKTNASGGKTAGKVGHGTIAASIREEDYGSIVMNMKEFKKSLIGDNDIYEILNFYENRWNMALSKENRRQNLSIVQEKISKRMRYIRFPSAESIKKEAADMIVTDEILKVIKDRDSLTKYIILYMTAYFMHLEER